MQPPRIIFFILCIGIPLQVNAAYDNPHFYRASNFFFEPRFAHDWLTSLHATVGGGSGTKSYNGSGNACTPLFDLYGTHNMHQLGVGVPNKDITNVQDLILMQLAQTPTRDSFANLSIHGKLRLIEANLMFAQNFVNGFFMQAHIPVRSFRVNCTEFVDLSPETAPCPNSSTPIWQTFLKSFDSILERYNLSKESYDKAGAGDLTVLLGWTVNHNETETLDYIDATIRAGVLIPTSPDPDLKHIFAIPFGYDGHWAFPLGVGVALGMYEWVTLGAHIDVLAFAKKTRSMRLKTSQTQNGIIKLAQGKAEVDRSVLWHAGTYFKADHVIRGFSFLIGYSYAQQNKTTVMPCNTCVFDPSIANADTSLNAWHMHTLHLALEFDFTRCESRFGPYVGVFYNKTIGGQHVFKTYVTGGHAGLNIAWDF